MSPYFTRCLLDDLKQSLYYSLHLDIGNKGNTRVCLSCLQFLSSSDVKKDVLSYFVISHSFLIFLGIVDLIDDADESANGISANVHQLIRDNGLDFNGLTGLGADNMNVNVCESHSVCSLFKEESPDILESIKILGN